MQRVVGLCFVVALALTQVASANVPETMSYQGVLRNAAGDIMPDGPYEFEFELYDTPSGGSVLWHEDQTLTVSDGGFSAVLGSVIPLDPAFDAPYWLDITVDGEHLDPRVELTSAPYALRAAVAESLDASASYTDGDWEEAGGDIYRLSGNVGVGTASPARTLDVSGSARVLGLEMPTGAGTGYVLTSQDESGVAAWSSLTGVDDGDWTESGGDLYRVDGNIGIGTDNPTSYKLDIESSGGGLSVYHDSWGPFGGTTARFERAGATPGSGVYVVGIKMPEGSPDDSKFIDCERGIRHEFYVGGDGSVHARGGATFSGLVDVTNNVGTRAATFSSDYSSSSTDVVYAEYTGTGGYDATAVAGVSTPSNGRGIGGHFEGGHTGVYGEVDAAGSSYHYGVRGRVSAQSSAFRYCLGVRGIASYGPGYGSGVMYGTVGEASGGSTNYGIFGWAGYGSTNYAGYFDGDVEVTGTISKAAGGFKIDHPLDPSGKYLAHSSVESPDMKNVYDGVVVLDSRGEAWVELAEWFEVLNGDFRYQLTAIGEPGPNLYIAEKISGSRFRIAGGTPGMEVSWMVTGIRRDPVAEELRVLVEEEKAPHHLGKYLHPHIYGLPSSMGIHSIDRTSEIEGQ